MPTLLNKTYTFNQQSHRCDKIWLKQGNKDAQTLLFTLTDGGVAIDLTACEVVFFATKPSGATLSNACSIISATSGKVAYVVTEQTSIESGVLTDCYLQIIKTGQVLNTFNLDVEILASKNYDTAIETASEFTVFEAAMGGLAANTSAIGTLASLLTTAKTNLVAAINELFTNKAPLASPTFTGSVVVPAATTATQAVNKGQLDLKMNLAGGSGNPFTAMPYVGSDPLEASGAGYHKHADGTLECFGEQAGSGLAADGGVAGFSKQLTFPVAFYAKPVINTSFEYASGNTWVGTRTVGNTTFFVTSGAAVGTIHWRAIGRWKA